MLICRNAEVVHGQRTFGDPWSRVLDEVITVDVIPVKPNAVPSSNIVENHPYLQGVDLHEIDSATVTNDRANFPEALSVEAARKGSGCCPDAVLIPLGWSLLGPAFDSTIDVGGEVNLCVARVGLHDTMPVGRRQARVVFNEAIGRIC